MVPNPFPQDIVVAAPPKAPPPLDKAQAHLGLTTTKIGLRNGHSPVAVWAAIQRWKMEHLLFHRFRLYSPQQAAFLKEHMRKPRVIRTVTRETDEAGCRPS